MNAVDVTRWLRETESDGTIVLTAPPVHPAFARARHAQLRIRRGQPLARLGARVERFVTRSGEYGSLHVEHLHIDGAESVRVTGSVIGVEQLVVEGTAGSPNIVALVRDLLVECAWLGAPDRIRMALYRPPAGWFGVRRELATIWLPPGAPRDPATLVVGDAVPRGAAERTHAVLWSLDPPPGTGHLPLDGTAVPATVATWHQAGRIHATATLVNARWTIRIGLRAGTEENLVVLRDVARSLELPPSPSATPRGSELPRWL